MQAVEALTRLIAAGDEVASNRRYAAELPTDFEPATEERQANREYAAQIELAVAVAQAMLNTAIPVARFRAHVTIDKVGPSSKMGLGDFTVCGVSIPCIKNGLIGLSHEANEVHITLWEQKSTGADMLSGYQGHSKSKNYRLWLSAIDDFEGVPA